MDVSDTDTTIFVPLPQNGNYFISISDLKLNVNTVYRHLSSFIYPPWPNMIVFDLYDSKMPIIGFICSTSIITEEDWILFIFNVRDMLKSMLQYPKVN